jgi:hypothetical protein
VKEREHKKQPEVMIQTKFGDLVAYLHDRNSARVMTGHGASHLAGSTIAQTIVVNRVECTVTIDLERDSPVNGAWHVRWRRTGGPNPKPEVGQVEWHSINIRNVAKKFSSDDHVSEATRRKVVDEVLRAFQEFSEDNPRVFVRAHAVVVWNEVASLDSEYAKALAEVERLRVELTAKNTQLNQLLAQGVEV